MASEEEKYKGYRPYFEDPHDWTKGPSDKVPLKEMTLMPSTIETIDYAFHEWVNEKLDIFATTNKGWKKVPVIWVANERAFQIKDNKDLRDANGRLKLPLITINRTSLIKDMTMKGVAWAHIPPTNDAKGGAVVMARRISQNKTSNFANADAYEFSKGQANYPRNNKKVVYETITSPMPTYVVTTYDVVIRTEYQQQINEIFTPFIVKTGQINNFFIHRDGHQFEGFIQGEFGLENNVSNMDEAERTYKTTINIKILAYLLGADKNEERPKIAIRENAVEVKTPRERVMTGDVRPWLVPPDKE